LARQRGISFIILFIPAAEATEAELSLNVMVYAITIV
jgi:hypothetical protein